MLTRRRVFQFLGKRNLAVISTVSERGEPEAALINYGVTSDLELIFETLRTSRKYANLYRNPRAALVMGFEGECETCQYEGIVDSPDERALKPLLDTYFHARPEALGHRDWPDLVYLRVRPIWIRMSNYGRDWDVEELSLEKSDSIGGFGSSLPRPPERR